MSAVSKLIDYAAELTTTGNWILDREEIERVLGSHVDIESLAEEFWNDDRILDVECYDDMIDIIIGLDYCPYYED